MKIWGEGIHEDSAAGDFEAAQPLRDGVLPDVLLLVVRLERPVMGAEARYHSPPLLSPSLPCSGSVRLIIIRVPTRLV
jgi:hypothetical protein